MHKITIAIDGFSSTGKSTIAKQLAAALGYIYVDTGAMYRAVTLYALHHGLISEDGFKASELCLKLKDIQLGFLPNEQTGRSDMLLNGKNVETEIRTMQVSRFVSQVATVKAVREKLVAIQQEMGKAKGIVMDGRDIGTVVFPHAELKLFMTASADARATRRYRELLERGDNITYGEVLENVQKRDYIDSNREESPLRRADDAILFDNSDMGLKEQFERIYNLAIRIIEEL